ncbi:fungal-specific transcription factor domain-containing protein [Durotheca rogersii]|uniref:fungal-specific transcription factor domain-containing protein n=1 Tax=Durotheca rogersii TaxID=419775 RepID=UPI00221F2082|nr:fungal-specific transcription factor domain-containing protein [Durotheca rogersii]KAI5863939.1 fungal-specific transcription factor domain-containing protein [Durotheca rogersii]
MSRWPPTGAAAGVSVGVGASLAGLGSDKHPPSSSALAPLASAWSSKLRSCVVCRSRKVRCDKQSPCSNCRRANIACVFPANDRPPKWARRLERVAHAAPAAQAPQPADPGVEQVMQRLQNLEGLVKELSGQLEQANAAARSSPDRSTQGNNSPGSSTHERDADNQASPSSRTGATGLQKHFGRMVLQDGSRSRYISSGFWSRVSDELDGLKMDARALPGADTDSSDDEDSPGTAPSLTQELQRTPAERHAFLFGQNLRSSAPDLSDFRPLPSHIPLLIDFFSTNVNLFTRTVHVPTVTKMIRESPGADGSGLTPANEALLFSMYYAAVTSMEEEDVLANFGNTRAELNLKYRLGLELALAKADFLNVPDLVLVQAFVVFLFLVRRYDSPRFVWMMTGLLIRMAHALGLHRDGSHFNNLTPFEVEMRRRAWWAVCVLDVRASEDQGTELSIPMDSFDTRFPLNINDDDIDTDTKETPSERQGITDMGIPLVNLDICVITRRMTAPGVKEGPPNLEEQNKLLKEMYTSVEGWYGRYSAELDNIVWWVGMTVVRLVMSKMRLLTSVPALFSALSSQPFSDEAVRDRLLVAAIEVAEHNHALNAEPRCRQWRWIYQTYTHWHSVVLLLMEVTRRPWSPLVERAWAALHSPWLIPDQARLDRNNRVWVPLRRLTLRARRHRKAELARLRADPAAAERLEATADRNVPIPLVPGPLTAEKAQELFRERWHGLVFTASEQGPPKHPDGGGSQQGVFKNPSIVVVQTGEGGEGEERIDASQHQNNLAYAASRPVHESMWTTNLDSTCSAGVSPAFGESPYPPSQDPSPSWSADPPATGERHSGFSYGVSSSAAADSWPPMMNLGSAPWLWADAADVFADIDLDADADADGQNIMDLDGQVDWNRWLASAQGAERESGLPGPGAGGW